MEQWAMKGSRPITPSPLSGSDLLDLLKSGPSGLTTAEAQRRLGQCGPNRLERVRRRSFVMGFLEQFWSFFALLLWVGGGFAFLAGMAELGWAIFAVIVVNGVFSFFQEYRAERAVEALQELLPHAIVAFRDGVEARLPTADLVPGDLVRLEEGDQVPADAQLLSAEGLQVDQSPLTGESLPVFKLPAVSDERERVPLLERHELVFAGTGVVAGTGTCVVTATGMATQIGAIAHLTQAVVEEPSPLQREMGRVTRIVTLLAVFFGLSFFFLGVVTGVLPPAEGFLFALGVIVANVPEGLLPTLTLALALGVQRMARQRSLVKRLSAVETLGATTVICTDKTGTLTQNRMAARFIWVSGRTRSMEELEEETPEEVKKLFEAAALGSQASPERGDPTEMALLAAAIRAGVDPEKVRGAHDLLAPYPFDSFRKRMTLVRAADSGATAHVKGAPKEMLALSTAVRWDGRTVSLTDERRRAILAEHDRMAAEGLRILAVASRRLPEDLVGAAAGAVERDLAFLGLIALWDPPRPEVAEAVALCRRAGIRVVMVTGDYGLTAQAIAHQVGLPVEKVITFASNVPELAPFLAFVFLGVPLPLTVMQILAVDLGTDLLPALALGAEPPEPGVMDRPPRPKSQRLLGGGRLLHAYAFLGVAEAALSLLAFFWTYWVAGWRPGMEMARAGDLYLRATTMTLAGIVAVQIGNVFACRTDRGSIFSVGLGSNRLVLLGIAAEIGIFLLLVLVPPFPYIFGLAPLAFEEWRLLLLFPPAMLLLEEARKWIVRRASAKNERPR